MKRYILWFLMVVLVLISGCTTNPAGASSTGELRPVKLPVGYIPNVQFAPLYVAIEKGFYRDAGLDVQIDYSMENDNAVLLANENLQFAILSGEQVLLARDKDMPLVYVTAWYQQYPVGIVSKAESGITETADLAGKSIGLPGLYGASYIGAIALLDSAGLTESDVTLDSIGYNQVEVLMAGRDDAVVVYVANEPVQLDALGQKTNLLMVSDATTLVANGLVTNETTIRKDPALVKSMVDATLKGIQYTMENPDEAYEISKKYVENLAEADQEIQKEVLLRSIELWKADRMGYSEPEGWENMNTLLIQMGLVSDIINVTDCYTNVFLK